MGIRTARLALAVVAALLPVVGAPAERWEQWRPVPGVFDVVGPRRDGQLIAAGAGRLYLVSAAGEVTPFADGYRTDPAFENYLALAPSVVAPACPFPPDEVYALEMTAPLRIVRITAEGAPSSFAELPGTEFLAGISFDTVGRFGGRLLVAARMAGSGGRTTVLAIDCRGAVTTVARDGPVVEGGLAVAPSSFGRFGGALVGPDEYSGDIVAFRADGTWETVAHPDLAVGADIGVESLGFVPPGFFPDGSVYVADRVSPGSPTEGTDTILRWPAAALTRADVREGDLLVSAESAGRTVAVRCRATCTVIPVGLASDAGHIEGHVTAVKVSPRPATSPPDDTRITLSPTGIAAIALGLASVVLALARAARIGRRRRVSR